MSFIVALSQKLVIFVATQTYLLQAKDAVSVVYMQLSLIQETRTQHIKCRKNHKLRGMGPEILRLYYGKLWINLMTSEGPLSSCFVLMLVVPPFLFTVTPFPATPTYN